MESKEKIYGSALRALQRYCARREACSFEIKQKLNFYNLTTEDKTKILDELIKKGFVNEERYAKVFVRDKFRLNKWGKIKISYQLRAKNIPGEVINTALKEVQSQEYQEIIEQEIRKKCGGKNNEGDKARIIRNLQSKGFELELILRAWDYTKNI